MQRSFLRAALKFLFLIGTYVINCKEKYIVSTVSLLIVSGADATKGGVTEAPSYTSFVVWREGGVLCVVRRSPSNDTTESGDNAACQCLMHQVINHAQVVL